MTAKRCLIVNADDFGQSPGVNRGIIKAHERGIVTSASLMVRWPAAAEAAVYGREHPEFSLGLHLDLGEWAFRGGTWVRLYEVVPENNAAAAKEEVHRQRAVFRSLVGRDPTHLDSHQHIHLREPVRSIALAVAKELRVPLRGCNLDVHYCNRFYGQTERGSPYPEGITVDGLIGILKDLPAGFTELGCHPGMADGLDMMYKTEREQETKVLCDPRVREAIFAVGIELRAFHNIEVTLLPESASPGSGTAPYTLGSR
jgi:chitin disaccharide deacetylase